MRNMLPLAALATTGITLGAGLAWIVPTEPRTVPNAEFERLSQARVVTYPGADRVVTGPDSYPITYSPQWLAVAERAERERLARWALPEPAPLLAYEQPPPERDLAVERQGVGGAEPDLLDPGEAPPEGEPPAT